MKTPLLVYLRKFMEKAELFPQSGRGVVGVSGGRDSMLLLYCLCEFKKAGLLRQLSVVHVDYGLRRESGEDGLLVKIFCDSLGVSREIVKCDLGPSTGNIEHRARVARYREFDKHLQKGDRLYLAHHLDDSFEWSLLQFFRSSNLRSSIGIPVKRKAIARPFMCLSRKQITFWANKLQVPWREDATNYNYAFARNYLRGEIIPGIAKRHPQYLKHYADKSNKLASALNMSVFHGDGHPWRILPDKFGGICLMHSRFENDFKGAQRLMTGLIEKLSGKGRGTLAKQVEKIISAITKGKEGPMIFSGGVYGFMQQGMIHFLKEEHIQKYKELDGRLALKLERFENLRIFAKNSFVLKDDIDTLNPGQIVFADYNGVGFCPGRRKIHPLWPATSKMALDKKIWFQFLSRFFYCWQKNKSRPANPLPVVSADALMQKQIID
ncbi:MAG: tRNA lysidine(34) synthetase TilS [Halobacteriovoraceae bacterium]|nr:tRNA lysidine(34) synthetase TilS [Halobacteriovoraceae bacterium]